MAAKPLMDVTDSVMVTAVGFVPQVGWRFSKKQTHALRPKTVRNPSWPMAITIPARPAAIRLSPLALWSVFCGSDGSAGHTAGKKR